MSPWAILSAVAKLLGLAAWAEKLLQRHLDQQQGEVNRTAKDQQKALDDIREADAARDRALQNPDLRADDGYRRDK